MARVKECFFKGRQHSTALEGKSYFHRLLSVDISKNKIWFFEFAKVWKKSFENFSPPLSSGDNFEIVLCGSSYHCKQLHCLAMRQSKCCSKCDFFQMSWTARQINGHKSISEKHFAWLFDTSHFESNARLSFVLLSGHWIHTHFWPKTKVSGLWLDPAMWQKWPQFCNGCFNKNLFH